MIPEPSVENQPQVLSWLQELPIIGPLTRSLAIQQTEIDRGWNANFDASPSWTSPLYKDATISTARICFTSQLSQAPVKLHDVIKMVIWAPAPTVIWQITFSSANEGKDSIATGDSAKAEGIETIFEACDHISKCSSILQKASETIKELAATRVILPQGRTWEIQEERIRSGVGLHAPHPSPSPNA